MPSRTAKPKHTKRDLAVVIPAFNEEQVIAASLEILTQIIDPVDIYVVSDGSTDNTADIAAEYANVLEIGRNVGKARALRLAIDKFELNQHYHYLLFSDADSRLAPGFLEAVHAYVPQQPACIVGKVRSDRHGLISAYRAYEYAVGFGVTKKAQGIMGAITVAPGCASLYRSDILDKLNFSSRTLTEDFDLTLQIHLKRLGHIAYAADAEVYTQDPFTLSDYWKQVVRWNTGFWQNMFLHRLYLPKSWVTSEIWLMLLDTAAWLASLLLIYYNLHLFLILLGFSIVTTLLFSLAVAILARLWWTIVYIPFFPIFQFINLAAYAYSFFRAIGRRSNKLDWNKVARRSISDKRGKKKAAQLEPVVEPLTPLDPEIEKVS